MIPIKREDFLLVLKLIGMPWFKVLARAAESAYARGHKEKGVCSIIISFFSLLPAPPFISVAYVYIPMPDLGVGTNGKLVDI